MKKKYIMPLAFIIIYIGTFITTPKLFADTVEISPGNTSRKDKFHLIDTTNLLSVHTWHLFSNTLHRDSFALRLSGVSVHKGTVHFTIYNSKHELIYHENFPANGMLWGNYVELTPKQQEDTIRVRLIRFFNKAAFIRPAISITDQFDSDNGDKAIWDEISSDKSAIGFIYSYFDEGFKAITYSKKRRKVVEYFATD